MNSLLAIFRALGRLIARALSFAESRGLTDALVQSALKLVGEADVTLDGNASKREWVVLQLVSRGVPESIARLAVELAVALYKGTVATPVKPVDPPPPLGSAA